MARDSSSLRASDLRTAYLLVGECCEMGADPLVWRRHLLSTLNGLFGAIASVDIEASFASAVPGIGARVEAAMSLDLFTPKEREILTRCLSEMPMEANPLGVALLGDCARNGVVAATRRQRVSTRDWRRSAFMTEYFGPLGWDDMLVAIARLPAGIRFFNFSKQRGDRPFTPRDSQLLQLVAGELAQIPPHRLAPLTAPSLEKLPRRLREVLLALAEGDGEKQIALRLKISRHTVHEYVQRLFERFVVSSRAELLVCAARQVHAANLAAQAEDQCWIFQSPRPQ
ncbi:MAG: response regulator transcription factor [Pirellulales bacterium]|nr:response regulator transcription factor [Pirellulales bacterium]